MGLPQTLAFTFPVEQLVCFGLAAWGDYWPALALSWAETFGVTPVVREDLRELMTHGKTQMIRHEAKRLFFRSGRTSS